MRLPFLLLSLLLWQFAPSSAAKDASFVQVAKTISYVQTNSGAPVLQTSAYAFRARVDLAVPQSVTSVTVKWPPPASATRVLSNALSYWEYSQIFPTSQALNLAHPNGTYSVVTDSAADGRRTNILTLSADVYPNPVHLANFAAAQTIGAGSPFVLQWDPPGTAATDLIQGRIFLRDQLIFETSAIPGSPAALSGLTTTVTIPKNTLDNGAVYRAQIIASRRSTSDTTGYPGVPAWAVYARLTEFTIRTVYPTVDVRWYGLAKLKRFTQNSVLPPSLAPSGAYALTAFTLATDPLNLQTASLKLPNGSLRPLTAAGPSWNLTDSAETQTLLDAAYPAGTYELNLKTAHNGSPALALPLITAAFPAPLQISNWNDASALHPAAPFTLKWLPVPSGNADDFCQVIARRDGQVLFRTPDYPGAPGALDGRSTSVNLPAGLLQPGESAELTLTLLKASVVDPFTYPQALGTIAYGCETRATLRARGGNVSAPALAASSAPGSLEINFPALAGRQYIIQSAADFQTWRDLVITNAPGSSFLFRLPLNQPSLGIRVLTY